MSEFGSVTLESFTLLTTTDLSGTKTNNTSVDTTGDAVLLFDVNFGQVEVLLIKCKVVFDISLARSVNQVTHLESLDGLIFGAHFSAVKASNDI